MGIIQRADLPEKIRRAFGLREPGVGSTISPEIVPVALVDDLTGPTIDEGYPRLCSAHVEAGASVGLFSEIFLINPASSRVDVVVQETWCLSQSGITTILFRSGVAASLNNLLGTQTHVVNLDLRVPLRPNAGIDSRNQAAVVSGSTRGSFRTQPNGHEIVPLQFTLPPGTWISCVPNVNNLDIQATYFFYERLRTTT